jgi:hypothetical protein
MPRARERDRQRLVLLANSVVDVDCVASELGNDENSPFLGNLISTAEA